MILKIIKKLSYKNSLASESRHTSVSFLNTFDGDLNKPSPIGPIGRPPNVAIQYLNHKRFTVYDRFVQ